MCLHTYRYLGDNFVFPNSWLTLNTSLFRNTTNKNCKMQQDDEQEKSQQLQNFQSDDLLEKLKLLNYEKHLLKEFKLKPLSRFYFVKATNPGEQFYMFTLICWWLCKKLGKDMERPQEYDDPNTVAANIIKLLGEIVSTRTKLYYYNTTIFSL